MNRATKRNKRIPGLSKHSRRLTINEEEGTYIQFSFTKRIAPLVKLERRARNKRQRRARKINR